MTYLIQICTERRTQPERMASVDHSLHPTGNMIQGFGGMVPEMVPVEQQLSTFTDADLSQTDFSDPQFIMVAEWDGHSPFVICHKGDYHARINSGAGWPDITKEQYDAAHPAAE